VPLFMVVEHFRNGEAASVYRRFKEHVGWRPTALRTSRVGSTRTWQPATNSWKQRIGLFLMSGYETGRTWLNLRCIQSYRLKRQLNGWRAWKHDAA
jgi:hypothetical protein